MESINLLAIFSENKTGQLARVTSLLKEANINIRWVSTAGTGTFGVVKFLVDDGDLAFRQLKHQGIPVTQLPAIAVQVEDRPGGLWSVAACLAERSINVENASGYVANNKAVLLLEVKDIAGARAALEESGFKLLTAPELRRI